MIRWFLITAMVSLGAFLTYGQNAAKVDPAVTQLYQQASQKTEAGDFKGAAAIYEQMIKRFPKIDAIWQLQFNLAYCYYLLGDNDKAVPQLEKVISKENPDQSLRERASLILCSAETNVARSQTDVEKKRQQLESAVRLYNNFLREFPKSTSRPDAFYGKAVALFYADKPEDADKNLDEFFKSDKETLKLEANYLRARIYTVLAKAADAEKKADQAKEYFEKARKIYDAFVSTARDLILANESLLSLGDVMLQNGDAQDAIRILHKVKPKDVLIEKQKEFLKAIHIDRTQAMANGNQALAEDLGQQEDRVRSRLATLEGQDSVYHKALQLISQAYFTLQKYDEVLLLNRHMLPHFTGETKKMANYIIIKALILKEDFELAIQEYNDFDKSFPKDPLSDDIIMTLARAFSKAKRFMDAVKWADNYISTFPAGKQLEEAYFMKADSYTKGGRIDDAKKASDAFRAKFPNSTLAGEALFYKAYASYQKKDYQVAATDFREFVTQYPDSENVKYALLNIADCFNELKNFEGAIKVLKEFEARFSTSEIFPKALFSLGKTYERNRNMDEANSTYARIVKDYSSHEVAPYAQYCVAVNLLSSGKNADANGALDQFIKQFPDHKLVPNAWFFKAEILKSQKKVDDAITAYKTLIEKFPESDSAADSYVALGDIYSQKASSMAGKPDRLPEEKQNQWKDLVKKAQENFEEVFKKFPKHASTDRALSQVSRLWQIQAESKFKEPTDARAYFENLSKVADSSLQVKISFTLGALMGQLDDQAAALEVMASAYEKAGTVSLPNEGYKQYRNALLANKQFDKAREVSERQLHEKKETGDTRGIAEAELGIGQALYEKEDYVPAGSQLADYGKKFPWYDDLVNEADFIISMIALKSKNFDEAIKGFKTLGQKARDPELKVRIFLNSGYAWLEKSETSAQGQKENLKEALGYFLRVGTAFSAFPSYAAEGLYKSGEIYEKYSTMTADAKTKNESLTNALKFYKKCADDYKETPWAQESRKRLNAMGK